MRFKRIICVDQFIHEFVSFSKKNMFEHEFSRVTKVEDFIIIIIMAGNLYTFAEIATTPVSADENFFIFFFKLSVLLSQQVKDSGESAGHIGHSRLVALTTPQLRCHRRGAEVTNYHSYIGLLFIWSWVRHQEEEEETGGRGGDGRAQEKLFEKNALRSAPHELCIEDGPGQDPGASR